MSSPASAQFRWLGVAGIELRAQDGVLVIDPFLTRFGPWRALGRVRSNRSLVAGTVRECDFVLVSHAHWDHLMDVPEVVRATGAQAFGSANTCRLLSVCGVPATHIRQIGAGDRLVLGAFGWTYCRPSIWRCWAARPCAGGCVAGCGHRYGPGTTAWTTPTVSWSKWPDSAF